MFNNGQFTNSPSWRKLRSVSLSGLIALIMFLTVALGVALAAGSQANGTPATMAVVDAPLSIHSRETWTANAESQPASPARQTDTALTVAIVSSPWAILDHNNPSGAGEEVPKVFVVEGRVTNNGGETAIDVTVELDYNEDPINGWVLLPGEYPIRTIEELAPGESYHAYWFARYSTSIGASHQYTVIADADNAASVSTSDNAYGNPEPGATVKTAAYLSTGNSGIANVSADVTVGVAFTVTVDYDMGNNARDALFSPVGNVDFKAGAYRLLSSQVHFYNDAGTQDSTVSDQLYFTTLPAHAENATATYTFIALAPADTRLCSYTGIGYSSTDKYDNDYCSEADDTVIHIGGSLSLSLEKLASNPTIEQNKTVTYTINYLNDGELPLGYGWIWDEVKTELASIIPGSISPDADPDETTASRVAWYLGEVPAGESGSFSFSVVVDGSGQDIADGTPLVNYAFFGINPGSLPATPALTSTTTTIIQAPTILVSKTDGVVTTEPGDALTYNLRITNTGSVAATDVVITDVLPARVNYTNGEAAPTEDDRTGQTLVWDSLGPIAPGGGTIVINVPVAVRNKVPDGTVLTNELTVRYRNVGGEIFDSITATDETTVNGPLLSITKSAFPDPVLANSTLTYTLEYANDGAAAATNVVITDVVPSDTTYQDCSGGTTCGESAGVVTWTIDSVPDGSTESVIFSVLVSGDLETGATVENLDYGIISDQTLLVTGPPVTTEVNKDAAVIDGYAFIDANGDGEFDTGEGILAGVAITLPQALTPTTTTDPSGYYNFRVEIEGPSAVSAALPDGYFRTTPGTVVFLDSILGITRTVNFGYGPNGAEFGTIFGTVFEDSDRDGAQNLGESGIGGVTISSDQAATSPVTTNEYGQYSLRFNGDMQATITETDPTFYVSTTPNQVSITAASGTSGPSPVDFGDFEGVQITGQVFDDVNVNGVNDDGAGILGATVTANDDSATTAAGGAYSLFATVVGSEPIQITENDPASYVSTNAVPGADMSRVDANTLRIADPVSGTIYTAGDFGDVLASAVVTITGQVWDDNGEGEGGGLANGIPDGTEPGLPGAVISLSNGLTQTTGTDGNFLLYAPPAEVIRVTETNPDTFVSTNAIPGDEASKIDNDNVAVGPLAAGATSAGNLFGDVLASSVAIITGTVFDDANENGVFDTNESGMEAVTVTLEIDGGNTITVTTDVDGQYQFGVEPGSDIRITSAGPGAAHYPTTPESIVARPETSGVYPDNDFGYSSDAGIAVIYGLVYDDANSNGDQDFGEFGLAGAGITLNGSEPITTTEDGLLGGTFTFSVTEEAVYHIHEENPPGYRSTTPDDLNVGVALGNSYNVSFGDTDSPDTASIYGVVFDDVNGNGQLEEGEPGLAGVVVSVTVSSGVVTETTGAYGQYNYGFDITESGFHTVSEQDPALPGYRSTTPDTVIVEVDLSMSYIVNFGDTDADTFSTIMGTVFEDISGDGLQDPGEPGMADVRVRLSNGQRTTTNALGLYTFAITETGAVRVTEIDPEGFHSTTPNNVNVNITALGQSYIVNFGDDQNAFTASFFGTVFDDQNVNGAWDLTEPPLSGVTVDLSGAVDPAVTNELGQFTFFIEESGTYTVTETDPTGYVSTIAITGDPAAVTVVDHNTLRARVELGTDLGDNLFGDALGATVITISGSVWNDNGAGGGGAGDGIKDPSEPLLAGATINLSSGTYQTTGADGFFELRALPGQAITVIETNPPGYLSTGSIPGNDATKVDNDTLRVAATLIAGQASTDNLFGDKLCTCGPDAYEDDDFPADATVLGFGLENAQEHDFCDDAVDWVKFTAKAHNVYTIQTSSWGQRADTFLTLFDTDGKTILAANDDYEDAPVFSSRIVWEAPANGDYFVRITNRADLAGCETDYEVWIEVQDVFSQFLPIVTQMQPPTGKTGLNSLESPDGVINHVCPDDFEIDDTWQQAHSITPGVVQTHSFDSNPMGFAADKDFIWFNAQAGRTVTFTVAPVVKSETLIELYDKDGDALNVTGTTELVWTPDDGGRRFLSVSPLTTTFGCADEVGYGLLMDTLPVFDIFLPLVGKGF